MAQIFRTHLIHRRYDEVYISPHLDDVVFSCGGRILKARASGQMCLVATVFTCEGKGCSKIPLEVRARVGDMAVRREEDRRAMDALGVDFLWLEHEEAVFRSPLYHTVRGTFFRYREDDRRMALRMAEEVERIGREVQARRLYVPLGVGNHVDHRMMCDVGLFLAERSAEPWDVFFYDDAPYAFFPHLVAYRMRALGVRSDTDDRWDQTSLWEKTRQTYMEMMRLSSVRAELGNWVLRGAAQAVILFRFFRDTHGVRRRRLMLSADVCDITSVFPAKMTAVAAYESQVTNVLGDLETFRWLQQQYSRRLGHVGVLERAWRAHPMPLSDDRRDRYHQRARG